jgi:Glycosyl hydrolases family 31/Domain of unknown function (DUF5110)/NPCBM-associated, NEW3 domain of alpha-galactosidase/Carbohydrate binding module (family 35)/IPT/TIG domain
MSVRIGIHRRFALSAATVGAVLAGLAVPAAAVPLRPGAAAQAGSARQHGDTVRAGNARFEVLTPTLVRLEYAADGKFEDGATFNVVDRQQPTPRFRTAVRNGVLTIRTDRLTLRYRLGSGRFTPANTAVTLRVGSRRVTGHPRWPQAPGSCRFATSCQAEDGRLDAGESVNYDHAGFTGRGFTADYGQVSASDSWTVTGVPAAGSYPLQIRYSNGSGQPSTLSVAADGAAAGTVTFPATTNWDTWAVSSVPVQLHAGPNTITTSCATGDGCNVNLDSAAVTAGGAGYPTTTTTAAPPVDVPGQLGGWTRGLDAYPNQAGADIGDTRLHPGILNRRGWSLLDDTSTALRTAQGWVRPRPAHAGAYQDGYLFGYGQDYQRALRDLRAITGPADMLPKWAAGVWFSEYFPYTAGDYENQLVPQFRAHHVPLDDLIVDTDWKSPQQWDGWNWNPKLFPDPQAFLAWADQQHLQVTLNVHAGIDASDPKFAQAQQTAKGKLQHAAQCFSPNCYRFDWSDPDQAAAWFQLHQPFEQEGVRQWWLDWCCTDSYVGMPGVTPDSWINELYAKDIKSDGLRGFNLARVGASFEDYRGDPASGPWGEHRSTVHFTGDTEPTWKTLAFEAHFSQDEASIGLPYVSEDIGSFKGKHLPDDLYARWVQLGTFQPVLRLHSDHGDRLPWEYGAAQQPGADALRLREALAPYTYTLDRQAYDTGLPLTRPLYLDYPALNAAYQHPDEYLYGPNVLVAPVTTPGAVASRTVWFPPGRWVDYFTGATYTGPGRATLRVPLDRMPVFVRAGGIVPEQPGRQRVDADPSAPLQLQVYAGASGRFTLYEDAGEGTGYAHGRFARTPLTYHEQRGRGASSSVTVGSVRGHFAGQARKRSYTVDVVDLSAPRNVRVDGRVLPRRARASSAPGWWYDARTATLHARTGELPRGRKHTVSQQGGRPVARQQQAAVALSIDPAAPASVPAGVSTTVHTTVTNSGPGPITAARLALTAPAGWRVAPAGPQHAGTVRAGSSVTRAWTVSAPRARGPATAALRATVSYTDAGTGAPGRVVTYQGPAANLPPTISSVDPSAASAGEQVTIHGANFGASRGDPAKSYVFFADGDTSWGAPFDGAEFHVDSWSDTAITFTVPTPSGPGGVWHVSPGDTAQVDVVTASGSSNTVPVKITG